MSYSQLSYMKITVPYFLSLRFKYDDIEYGIRQLHVLDRRTLWEKKVSNTVKKSHERRLEAAEGKVWNIQTLNPIFLKQSLWASISFVHASSPCANILKEVKKKN